MGLSEVKTSTPNIENVNPVHFCTWSAPGTFRTQLLELMMSVHWVKADLAVASVAI
jgi:hypothetical protein